ncbi:GNAT family N-acetyltransferase [Tumebacillus amylolyticus]|nr:GNAT family N-acetyltransferase [Tumebacillus amylolyticus]
MKEGLKVQTTPVRDEDESFLFALFTSTREQELQAWGWDEAMQQHFLQMQWRAQCSSYSVQFPQAEHLLLCHDQQPVGRVILNHSQESLHLVDITLHPNFRGQGIGTRYLLTLQQEGSESGQSVILNVRTDNPARRLYERLGFASTGEDELYVRMAWHSKQK